MPDAPLAIDRLLDAAAFPHPVQALRLIETHISWVILTGRYAYKIKKPVNMGFLDFSTLERRAFFCHEELRLNRRLAPGLYLDVVAITGTPEAPRLRDGGAAIEYAVKMRQFPQEALLDRLIAAGALTPEQVDTIARVVASFHTGIPAAPTDGRFGTPAAIQAPVEENFRHILPLVREPAVRERLESLQAWGRLRLRALYGAIARRRQEGFVRECHGDMHLGNMAEVDGRPTIFDAIEFNENLRWIDVMSEVGFLCTDFTHRGRPDFEWRCLNGYLERTGDYAGLSMLRYYQAYRAMVRAKVARIRLAQADVPAAERPSLEQDFLALLGLAEGYTRPDPPRLMITRGVSASGKTWLSQALLERLGAVRLRSDVERKRLFRLAPETGCESAPGQGIYTPQASDRTYARLLELADAALTAGYSVIVDATFLERRRRTAFQVLAARRRTPFTILDLRTDPSTASARITARSATNQDASDAGLAVLEQQLANYGPLEAEERGAALAVDATGEVDTGALARRLLNPP